MCLNWISIRSHKVNLSEQFAHKFNINFVDFWFRKLHWPWITVLCMVQNNVMNARSYSAGSCMNHFDTHLNISIARMYMFDSAVKTKYYHYRWPSSVSRAILGQIPQRSMLNYFPVHNKFIVHTSWMSYSLRIFEYLSNIQLCIDPSHSVSLRQAPPSRYVFKGNIKRAWDISTTNLNGH